MKFEETSASGDLNEFIQDYAVPYIGLIDEDGLELTISVCKANGREFTCRFTSGLLESINYDERYLDPGIYSVDVRINGSLIISGRLAVLA